MASEILNHKQFEDMGRLVAFINGAPTPREIAVHRSQLKEGEKFKVSDVKSKRKSIPRDKIEAIQPGLRGNCWWLLWWGQRYKDELGE